MRAIGQIMVLCAAAAVAAASLPCDAAGYGYRYGYHGYRGYAPRTSVGVYVGAPFYWPGSYYRPYVYPYPYPFPYSYPYYPPAVVGVPVPVTPPTYIEQSPAATGAAPGQSDNWWYYCPSAEMYYPYAKECSEPWQRVPPQPPS